MTILRLMCDYYLFHPPMWMFLRLYSFMNKPPWPINYMCNQNLITNLCIMCIMGMLRANARLNVSILTEITLLINPYKILSNDSNGNGFIF